MSEYFGSAGRQAVAGLTLAGKLLTLAIALAFFAVIILGSIGAAYGGKTLTAAQAVTVQFVGKGAVIAQENVAKQVLQCGQETGTMTAITYVDPPFKDTGATPGPAMKAPGALALALVGCLAKVWVSKGATVDTICPPEAANAGGLTAAKLPALVTVAVTCATGGAL